MQSALLLKCALNTFQPTFYRFDFTNDNFFPYFQSNFSAQQIKHLNK